MSYSLIIPVFNEKETIPKLLNQLKDLNNNIEIILIDDGSDDGTDTLLKNSNKFKILRNKSNCGKGFAIRKGINHAKNQNVILMDGDLEVDLSDIPVLIKEFESIQTNNKKAVIGVRWKDDYYQYFNLMRFGNLIINIFFNIVYRTSFKDILCCFKIIKRSELNQFHLVSDGFSIETELMINLVINNFQIKEKQISYSARSFNQGKKIKLRDSIDIIKTIISRRL